MFLLQEKIYLSPVTKIINNLFFQSEDFITKQIIREFFFKKSKTRYKRFLLSFNGTIEELNIELDENSVSYKTKKKVWIQN